MHQIADLAKDDVCAEVAAAYAGHVPHFGPDYLLPTPLDPRLILRIARAVAMAAESSGVASRPIADVGAYVQSLNNARGPILTKPVSALAVAKLETGHEPSNALKVIGVFWGSIGSTATSKKRAPKKNPRARRLQHMAAKSCNLCRQSCS